MVKMEVFIIFFRWAAETSRKRGLRKGTISWVEHSK